IIDGQGTVNLDLGWKLVDSFEYFVDTKAIQNYGQLMETAAKRKEIERKADASKPGAIKDGPREASAPKKKSGSSQR
ncbi:MAG: hypothetical protein P1V35_10145, partial [Planctomycetota bacterium]|nr:hypothetical protein [Planctomycetota bacterium]